MLRRHLAGAVDELPGRVGENAAEPPRRRGQARSSNIRELGTDPVSGKTITVRSGRFGPYVTDGEVNASLRQGDSPEDITLERAAELLQARRERLGA